MVRKFNLAATAMIALALVTGACSSLLESQAPPECEGGRYVQGLSMVPRSDRRAAQLIAKYSTTETYYIPSEPPVTGYTTENHSGQAFYTANDRRLEDEHWERVTRLGVAEFSSGFSRNRESYMVLQNEELEICVKDGVLYVRKSQSRKPTYESVYSGSKENR
jgi:hypothetical protein